MGDLGIRSVPDREHAAVSINTEGLRLSPSLTDTLDVLFDSQRVWSISPVERTVESHGERSFAWPEALRPHLDGLACVTVRVHVSGEILAEEEIVFGTGQGRVRVVDRQGRPLAMEKWDRLNHPFESAGPEAVHAYLDQVEEVLAVLQDECDLPAFLSYGSLLGATREGKVIGHDVDADLGYLSSFDHPVDVMRESFAIERKLRAHGWSVRRENGGFLALWFPQPDGSIRNLDVFTCFFVNGFLHQVHDLRAALPRSAVLPLSSVMMEGRRFPAPADPAAILKAAYGPGWRVPDPSFKFDSPATTRRRIRGWLGGVRDHRDYWNRVHSTSARNRATGPSPFAEWVHQQEPADTAIVDLGCGPGVDSLWFAQSGREVIGLDYSDVAVGQGRTAARQRSLSAHFELLNLYDLRYMLSMGARLGADQRPKAFYSRFLIESLEDHGAGRNHLWRLAEMALRGGGRLYLEFRAHEKPRQTRGRNEAVRRLVPPDTVVDEIRSRGGRIDHREQRWAQVETADEPAYICRLVARWT